MSTYNTNLASEFWVLSVLHRLGADASLTLGNKKAVDIVIATPTGRIKTLDVKGVAGPYDWPADNIRLPAPRTHFYAFLSFNGRIQDPTSTPDVWIVPAAALRPFIRKYKTRVVVSRAEMRNRGKRYLRGWRHLVRQSVP